jgi:DNA-binding winged helix-turn-helix (wHTH) protein
VDGLDDGVIGGGVLGDGMADPWRKRRRDRRRPGSLAFVTFLIGDLRLDPERRELHRDGQLVPLEPQGFDVLVHLVRHRDRVVPKEELMDEVWGGRFVSETAVTSRIKQVRRALGDDGQTQTHVRTYHGRGYRFVAEAREAEAPGEPARPHTAPGRADQQADAWFPVLACPYAGGVRPLQISGQGPPDVLLLGGSADDLADEWADPERGPLIRGLGAMARVLRTAPGGGTAELVAVLDHAASASAVVLAVGEECGPGVALAQEAPERVDALVLVGARREQVDGDPGVATLVLHDVADAAVPLAEGRAVAAAVPGAEFRAIGGDVGAAGPLLDAVEDLVEDVARRQAPGRALQALVGLAGDGTDVAVTVLTELGGTVRRGPERAVVVSFDGPAEALRALGSRRARGLVDQVGVGLAIDEVSRDALLVSGHGVDVARLLALRAGPGEVLLPNVIKDLLAGSGLRVETLEPVDLPHVGPHQVHRWLRRP